MRVSPIVMQPLPLVLWAALLIAPLGAQAPREVGLNRNEVVRELEAWTRRAQRSNRNGEPNFRIAEQLLLLHVARSPLADMPGMRPGEEYLIGTYRNLVVALSHEPGHTAARDLAARLLLARGEREPLDHERALLRTLTASAHPEPRALIVLARDARVAGMVDSAAALLEASAAAGGDRSLIALEMARVQEARGNRSAALASYWEGLRGITSLSRSWYRYDLGWLLVSDSLEAFDVVPDSALPAWLRRFWRQRDAASAGFEGDRLFEHLHRWRLAVQNYRVPQPMRKTQFERVEVGFEDLDQCIPSNAAFYEQLARNPPAHPEDARAREALIDHRGLVTLRHGEPVWSIFTPGNGLPYVGELLFERPEMRALAERGAAMDQSMFPNETWVFWINGGLRELHFRGSQALGFHAPTTLSSFLPLKNPFRGNYTLDWSFRAAMLPAYGAAAGVYGSSSVTDPMCHGIIKEVIASARVNASIGINTDSDTPPLPRDWKAFVQAFGVGNGADRTGRALLTYAIPLHKLQADTLLDGRVLIEAAFRVVAFERESGRVIELDSTRRVTMTTRPRARDHLTGLLEVDLPAGDWQVAIRAGQPLDSLGLYALHPHVRIPEGTQLSVSDIVTGMVGATPSWNGSGTPFPINAMGTWPVGSSVELYAEIGGANTNQDIGLTIEVAPIGGDPASGLRIASREAAEGTSLRIRRSLGLAQLPPGQYTIRLTAEQGNRRVTQARSLLIYRPEAEAR
jgi:hypothetical protein